MLTNARFHKTVASCLVALLLSPLNAQAQLRTSSGLDAHGHLKLERLKVPADDRREDSRAKQERATERPNGCSTSWRTMTLRPVRQRDHEMRDEGFDMQDEGFDAFWSIGK